MVAPTHGTTAALAKSAYGAKSKKIAAVNGHVPICVAIVNASTSRKRAGSAP